MEAEHTSTTSRRELHRPRTQRGGRRGQGAARRVPTTAWLPRGALLGGLAAATIAVPLLGAGAATDGAPAETVAHVVPAGSLTAYDVLASPAQQPTPTSLLAALPGARSVAATVSRSLDRSPLPACDGQARPASANGQIPSSDLCTLWGPSQALRGDAAVALAELNLSFRAVFGRDLCITDSYRPLSVQRILAATKPGLAAVPGRSNHGWGLAVDLCATETGDARVMGWLRENGPTFGWDNPLWARSGGSGPYEPWHWEYVPGTTAMGTNWDD